MVQMHLYSDLYINIVNYIVDYFKLQDAHSM